MDGTADDALQNAAVGGTPSGTIVGASEKQGLRDSHNPWISKWVAGHVKLMPEMREALQQKQGTRPAIRSYRQRSSGAGAGVR